MIISAFNALSLSPALAALLLRPKKPSAGALRKFFDWFNHVFRRATDGYVNVSRTLIRKSGLAVAALLVFGVVAIFFGAKLPSASLPTRIRICLCKSSAPNSVSLSADQAAREIENIAKMPGVQYTTSVIGFSLLSYIQTSYNAFFSSP